MARTQRAEPLRRREGARTAAQAQDFDVVPRPWPRQGEHGRGEEHGLVVGVRDQEADALVAQGREACGRDADGVHVYAWDRRRQHREEAEEEIHLWVQDDW